MDEDIVIKRRRSDPGAAAVEEQFAGLGAVEARRMFSGHGVFLDGLMFALLVQDRLYLKADERSRARFVAAGSQPFTYLTRRRGVQQRVALSYWSAPEAVLESRAAALRWGGLALEAAQRQAAGTAARPSARRARAGSVTRKK